MDLVERKNHSDTKPLAESSPGSLTIILFLLFPVLLHAIGITVSFVRIGSFSFGRLDLLALLCLCFYLSFTVFIISKREMSRKFVLLVYSFLLPVAAVESIVLVLGSTTDYGLPWPPMQTVSTAASTMPGIEGEISFTVNNRGVRAPQFWPISRNDRILCVGGSTTECLYVTDEKSWPWLLGTRLTETLGRRVLVASAGRSGNFTLHHLYQLRHYKVAHQFGVVIILCGMNDAGTLLRGNYEKRAAAVADEALTKDALTKDDIPKGAYYRYSYLVRALNALRTRCERTPSRVEQDLAGEWYAEVRQKRQRLLMRNVIRSVPGDLQANLETYQSNLEDIINLCSNREQRLVFLTQPTLYHKEMPSDLAALILQHTDSGAHTPEVLAEVISAYNATLKSVCKQYNIACVDLASQLPKDTSVFYDDCHFNISGCDAVASVLCEYLEEELQYQHTDHSGVAQP